MKAIYQLYKISLGFNMFYTDLIGLTFRFQFLNSVGGLEDLVPLITVGTEHLDSQAHFEILCLNVSFSSVFTRLNRSKVSGI